VRDWLTTPSRGRELALMAIAAVGLAVIVSWPLVLHPGHRIAQDLGDPVRTAWQLAWVGHALIHQPFHLWNSNAFWPYGNSLAFSDSLLGYAPAALIGHGQVAALVRYNLLFLFAYALAFAGAYLLGRELGLRPLSAAVVGVAFAYAPFRSTMNGHLHVISSGGIPLSLFLLLRGYRRGSAWLVFAGWLVATWQLSLGFTLGLQLAYLLAVLAVITAAVWWRRDRPRPPRSMVTATLVGVALFAVVGIYQSRPYLQVSHDFASARRSIGQVRNYSASPRAFIASTPENRIWSGALASQRNSLRSPNEMSLFPGLSIVLLALAGVTSAVYAKGLRIGLAIGLGSSTGGSAIGCCTTTRRAGTVCARRDGSTRSPRSGWRSWRALGRSGSPTGRRDGALRRLWLWRSRSSCWSRDRGRSGSRTCRARPRRSSRLPGRSSTYRCIRPTIGCISSGPWRASPRSTTA